MSEEKKYLYCLSCEGFPDEIEELLERVIEIRRWNGAWYELTNTRIDGVSLYFCSRCHTQLGEKEEKDDSLSKS